MEASDAKSEFEMLVLDTSGDCVIKTDENLLHLLLAHGRLWTSPSLDIAKKSVVDGQLELIVHAVPGGDESGGSVTNAFDVRVSGPFEELEPFRHPLAQHLETQKLGPLYILKDEVSEKIACEIYPLLYRIENALRGYLIKFMTTRLGPRWWELTATGDWNKKVHQRRQNEQVFAEHIDNNAYLVDFGDLGKMIYAQSSGFTSKDDIIKKVSECEETPTAIRALKTQLQTNYHKFFKESFKDKQFQDKWEKLEKIRHKVAHNNLFTKEDLEQGKGLATELIDIVTSAADQIDDVVIPSEEKEAIKSNFVSHGWTLFDVVTEEVFLEELKKQQEYFHAKGGFVGLSHFVKEHLGYKGYDYGASYEMASRLEAQGKVGMYQVDNPTGDFPVTAINIPVQEDPKSIRGGD